MYPFSAVTNQREKPCTSLAQASRHNKLFFIEKLRNHPLLRFNNSIVSQTSYQKHLIVHNSPLKLKEHWKVKQIKLQEYYGNCIQSNAN